MAGVKMRRGSVLLDLGLVRAIRPLWIALLLFLPAVAQAQFTFKTNNGAITITGYTGTNGILIIPSTKNGYPVTSIGNMAFYQCVNLTNVTIGNNVTNIGSAAFWNCNRLASITVDPDNPSFSSVSGVLFNKSQTVLITYPAGLSGRYTIPNGVTNIVNQAFDGCIGFFVLFVMHTRLPPA